MAERAFEIPFDDVRLGRHVRHDARNFNYRAVPEPRRVELRDVRHRRRGRRLDQDRIPQPDGSYISLGACTFYSLCHALKCDPLWRGSARKPALNHDTAVRGYSRATELDPFPGTYKPADTGSSGQAACQAGVEMGLLARYDWAFGGDEARAALVDQPVMFGTWWPADMFHPDRDGRAHPTGGDAGGHEYTAVGLDVERRRMWFWNTWGEWGYEGSGLFYLTWDDADALLARQGDVVVPRIAA